MRWQVEKCGRVVRWQGGRIMRWQNGRFLVFFKGLRCRVGSRFHLFVSMLIKEMKEQDVFKIFLRSRRNGKILLRSYRSC